MLHVRRLSSYCIVQGIVTNSGYQIRRAAGKKSVEGAIYRKGDYISEGVMRHHEIEGPKSQ